MAEGAEREQTLRPHGIISTKPPNRSLPPAAKDVDCEHRNRGAQDSGFEVADPVPW